MKNTLLTLLLTGGVLAATLPVHAGLSSASSGKTDYGVLLAPADKAPHEELTVVQAKTEQDANVIYTTRFTNNTLTNADIIDIVNPIPADGVYLPNSATGNGCEISFSVDGGITWGQPAALFVRNATGGKQLAQASDYTHIRWIHNAGLPPKASSQVSFMMRYH